MKIIVHGQAYDYDAARLQVNEAILIHQLTGLNLQKWQAGLGDMDPYAVKALVWLIKRRAGEQVEWEALDFDLGSVELADAEVPT